MKKLVLSVALVAFGLAVQAGDCCKATQTADKASCPAKAKVATSTTASSDKAQCSMAKESCSAAKESCSMAKAGACKDNLAKQILQSPKGFEQAKR
jgi:hypothetical protein